MSSIYFCSTIHGGFRPTICLEINILSVSLRWDLPRCCPLDNVRVFPLIIINKQNPLQVVYVFLRRTYALSTFCLYCFLDLEIIQKRSRRLDVLYPGRKPVQVPVDPRVDAGFAPFSAANPPWDDSNRLPSVVSPLHHQWAPWVALKNRDYFICCEGHWVEYVLF